MLETQRGTPKNPLHGKRDFRLGSGLTFDASWVLASGEHPAPACKRAWNASGGHRRDFMVGCPLAAAAVLSCKVQPDRSVAPHLAVRTFLIAVGGLVVLLGRCSVLLYGLPLGCLLLTRARGLSRLRFRGFGKSMMSVCSSCRGTTQVSLMRSPDADEVSRAWLVWSGAAENALADA